MIIVPTIGENIKAAREDKDLTQSELGRIIGASARVVGNWEKGINNPGLDSLVALCTALDVTPAYLLNYQDASDAASTALSNEETALIENFQALDRRGKATIQHILAYEKEVCGEESADINVKMVVSNIPSDMELTIAKKHPAYPRMRNYCSTIAKLQDASKYSDLEVAKFLWSLGLTDFSGGDMLLIKKKLRVPSPQLAHLITCFLTNNFSIMFPENPFDMDL